ncbi:MAG: TIGR02281 family clan AA aspartic protease [Candidatus Binatia bacterium]
MLKVYVAAITVLVLCSTPVSSRSANIYRWVDKNGVVHFTDNPYNIPGELKGRVKQIKTRKNPRRQAPLLPLLPDKVSIPFQKKGEVVIVEAVVNQKTSKRFIVDTGASYTMISHATAKELGIGVGEKLPTIPFQTANGVIHAPLISLDSIEIGGMQVKGLTAAIHDVFPDPKIAGLLGLNFLRNFRMDFDTHNHVLVLEKK